MTSIELLFLLGRPFSPIYSFIMTRRASFYKSKILKSHTLPVPVISVGNLTMGGTGKTPMVAMLAKQLSRKGYKPAIISRGYGGTATGPANIVSDGQNILLEVEKAGDEPTMLATLLPAIPVLTGKKRITPCRHAVDDFNVDIIILDDGFQHLGVNREINIVLFNATTLAGNSRVFPGGDLREPVNALHRADIFVLTGVDDKNEQRAKAFQEILTSKFPLIPVCFTRYSSPCIYNESKCMVDPSELPGPVVAFSGIAHPSRFFSTLDELGFNAARCLEFKDHVTYRPKEIRKIKDAVRSSGAGSLITTLKDKVKLADSDFGAPLFHVEIETEPAAPLMKFIFDKITDSDLPENP